MNISIILIVTVMGKRFLFDIEFGGKEVRMAQPMRPLYPSSS
jgi:hypothetical protein